MADNRERVTSPRPAPQTGNVKNDILAMYEFLHNWYRVRVIEQNVAGRLDAIRRIAPLSQTISATPTQAEVEALQNKLNEIIEAAQ